MLKNPSSKKLISRGHGSENIIFNLVQSVTWQIHKIFAFLDFMDTKNS